MRLCNQGYSYKARFSLSDKFEDAEEAIKCYTKAAALVTGNNRGIAVKLNHLGVCCTEQFAREKKLEYADQATACFDRAISLVPNDYSLLPLWYNNQGCAYKERFSLSKNLSDISNAIDWYTRSVERTPNDDKSLPERLNHLGNSYLQRFDRSGELNDINQAISYLHRTVSVSNEDNLNKPLWLANLGKLYRVRYSSLGGRTDIDQAVDHGTHALELAPEGYSQLPFILNCLARTYQSLFSQTGVYEHIDKAIKYQHRAVAMTTQAAVLSIDAVTKQYADLGLLYSTRYLRLGDSDDFGHASQYLSDSISSVPQDHPDLPWRLSCLGECYAARFYKTQTPSDMGEAVQYYTRSLALDPKSPFKSDFDKAIDYLTRAIDATPSNGSELPLLWNCLTISYENSFCSTGDPEEIDKAIEYMNRALKITDSSDFYRPLRLKNLGLCYWTQFCRVPNKPDSLTNALSYLQEATLSTSGSPQTKFSAAIQWGRISAQHSHVSNPIPAYQVALGLITEVAWLGNTVEKRYSGLYEVRELAMEAAAVAIDVGKYALALEWLEQARSVVWNQDLQLRSPVDQLTSKYPALAQEFTTISAELLRVGNGAQDVHTADSYISAKEETAQRHRRLAEEYASLLSRIRELHGFENFMRPKKLSDFHAVSWRGPVVVVNCHKNQCDALILIPHHTEVIHLALPMLSDQKARQMRSDIEAALFKSGIRERSFRRFDPMTRTTGRTDYFETTLAALWTGLARPVLDLLGYTSNTSPGQLPHITWCLTGPLSFLPLHAAGYYDRPGAKLSDFAVSSYAPTIGALRKL
ncbi:unnamed protein product [Rhizoctonia solani]|uniref:CHAT domain-containing protein n=1 Tax=Rhizoctonia solani TaxID=456999 RepID=A0A8H3HWQ9_9AGAM|nr:unnamed protein product [Rhizoctonia solani]